MDRTLKSLLYLALISVPAHGAEPVAAAAENAYARGAYPEAFKRFRQLAEKGDVASEVRLARMYLNGIGTQENRREAERWAVAAAEKGDVTAQFLAAEAKLTGWTEAANPDKGKALAEAACKHGVELAEKLDVPGTAVAAKCYLTGLGLPEDRSKGVIFLKRAANWGYPESQLELGRAYAQGQVLPKSPERAYFWLGLAKERGELFGKDRNLYSVLGEALGASGRERVNALAVRWEPAARDKEPENADDTLATGAATH